MRKAPLTDFESRMSSQTDTCQFVYYRIDDFAYSERVLGLRSLTQNHGEKELEGGYISVPYKVSFMSEGRGSVQAAPLRRSGGDCFLGWNFPRGSISVGAFLLCCSAREPFYVSRKVQFCIDFSHSAILVLLRCSRRVAICVVGRHGGASGW